jgi:hypothetical protein
VSETLPSYSGENRFLKAEPVFLCTVNRLFFFIAGLIFFLNTGKSAMGNSVFSVINTSDYTDKGGVKKKGKGMGLLGRAISIVLKGKLSKKLFAQYWTGKGNYYLSTNEVVLIASEINRMGSECCTDSAYIKGYDSVHMQRKLINFYLSKELAHALGYSTVYFEKNILCAFYDDYDFNPKPWGVRPFFHEIKTRFMHWAGKLRGAQPYEVIYGRKPD